MIKLEPAGGVKGGAINNFFWGNSDKQKLSWANLWIGLQNLSPAAYWIALLGCLLGTWNTMGWENSTLSPSRSTPPALSTSTHFSLVAQDRNTVSVHNASVYIYIYICLALYIIPQLKIFQTSSKFPLERSLSSLGHENPPWLGSCVPFSLLYYHSSPKSHLCVRFSLEQPGVAFSPPSFSHPWSSFRSLAGCYFSRKLFLQPFWNIGIHSSLKTTFDYNNPLIFSVLHLLCFIKLRQNLRSDICKSQLNY